MQQDLNYKKEKWGRNLIRKMSVIINVISHVVIRLIAMPEELNIIDIVVNVEVP